MKKWSWVVIVGLLFTVTWYILLQGELVGGTLFWSCPATYHFRIDKKFLIEHNGWQETQGPRIVILSCDYRVTKQGAGSGEGDPMYYTEQAKWRGINVQRIYLSVPVWWGKESGERDKVLSYFLLLQMAGSNADGKQTAVEAYKAKVAPIGILELGAQR